MFGTFISAALICAASLLVGRAIFVATGRDSWTWLEPAVGFAAIIAVAGIGARLPGGGTAATLLVLLVVLASLPALSRPYRLGPALAEGLPVIVAVRAGPRDPVRGERALGPARGGLQQRPRPPPRLERVAAQRLRTEARRGLSARTARALDRRRQPPQDRPRPRLHRADHRDHGAHRPHGAGGAARPRAGAAHPRRAAGRSSLPRRLLLRAGRLQGDRRGALRARLHPGAARDQGAARGQPGTPEGAGAAARARGGDLLLLQLRRACLAGGDRGALEPHPAGGARLAGAAGPGCAACRARRPWPGSPCSAPPRCCSPSSGPSASPAASARSPAATPTAPSPRSRRSGSGPPPTTASTPPGAPRTPGSPG